MATPVQRRAGKTVIVGVVVLVVIFIALFLTFKAQTGAPFRTTTEVKAEFQDIHSLRTNDDIRANSKRIGRVSALDYSPDGTAVVTMEIDGDYPVYNDAHAEIWDYSALATKFVELRRGTPQAGPLANNTVPVTHTDSSKDLNQVLEVLDPPTRASATASIRELGGGLAGRQEDLGGFLHAAPRLLGNLGTVSGSLTGAGTNLRGVLASADNLVGSLASHDRQISALVGEADRTMQAIGTQHARPIADTLDRAPDTLNAVRPALDELNGPLDDAASAIRDLEPGGKALAAATPDLRGVLREGGPVLDQVPDVSDSAKPALEDLTDASHDLRPLVPRVADTTKSLDLLLHNLAPYSKGIGLWIPRVQSFVSQGSNNQADPYTRFARVGVAIGPSAVTGPVLPGGN